LDVALKKIDGINRFLQQGIDEKSPFDLSMEMMDKAIL
jgi:flagellar biosynthesis/type III secretory pathway ATPase